MRNWLVFYRNEVDKVVWRYCLSYHELWVTLHKLEAKGCWYKVLD